MKRRSFIRNTLLGSIIPPNYIKLFSGINGEDYPELKKHRITRVERVKHSYHWPRHVGKNARKGNHGQYNSDDIFKLFTDKGAMGWAHVQPTWCGPRERGFQPCCSPLPRPHYKYDRAPFSCRLRLRQPAKWCR